MSGAMTTPAIIIIVVVLGALMSAAQLCLVIIRRNVWRELDEHPVPLLDPDKHTAGERIAAAVQAFHEHQITLVVLADEIDDALTSYR